MRTARAAAALAALVLAAGCSGRAKANYKHCLTLRIDMTKAEMLKIMGPPDAVLPYVEGTTPDYLKGRTAYEWSNPADMPSADHVGVNDAAGKIESIRCADAELTAPVFVEPPAAGSAAASRPAAAPVQAAQAPSAGTLDDAVAAFRKKDLRLALKIDNPLAGTGEPQAELLLGMIFHSADAAGLNKNENEALRWFYQSSRQNNCEAAALYAANIQGHVPDKVIVRETRLASSLGCPAGKLLQAALLTTGVVDLVAPDAAAAEQLMLGAAQDGSSAAQLAYARRLKDGANKDLVEACRWTLLASRHPLVGVFDDPLHGASNVWTAEDKASAESLLKDLRRAMTAAQIAQAEKLAAP